MQWPETADLIAVVSPALYKPLQWYRCFCGVSIRRYPIVWYHQPTINREKGEGGEREIERGRGRERERESERAREREGYSSLQSSISTIRVSSLSDAAEISIEICTMS